MPSFRERHPELFYDSKEHINIKMIKKEGDAETYYPATTDDVWRLVESFITFQPSHSKRISLLTMARKYKDTPNADFIKFYNNNGTLFIENVPSPKVDFNYGDEVQMSYFVRDFKTGNIHFPKPHDEAWNLVKKLLPKDLVEKAMGLY